MDGFGTQKQAAHITWCKDYNKPHYAPGQNRKVAISTEAYIEAAIEDVLYAYLLVGKQWKYLNTCARKPGFRPITQQTMYGVGSPQNYHMFDLTTKSRETAAKSGYGTKR